MPERQAKSGRVQRKRRLDEHRVREGEGDTRVSRPCYQVIPSGYCPTLVPLRFATLSCELRGRRRRVLGLRRHFDCSDGLSPFLFAVHGRRIVSRLSGLSHCFITMQPLDRQASGARNASASGSSIIPARISKWSAKPTACHWFLLGIRRSSAILEFSPMQGAYQSSNLAIPVTAVAAFIDGGRGVARMIDAGMMHCQVKATASHDVESPKRVHAIMGHAGQLSSIKFTNGTKG